ncbi:complement C1q-like protein 3 [Ylistrum balloti]|uniref:complement C1q-like protein 3 n=1 Tax=Ylistrum balloti TaxID=509963 RepID=UPI002905A901|nr:complement C1q-like protein 3 [Ylistrum balloti]
MFVNMTWLSILTICILISGALVVKGSSSDADDGTPETEMTEIKLLLQKYGTQIESLQRENVRLEKKLTTLERQCKLHDQGSDTNSGSVEGLDESGGLGMPGKTIRKSGRYHDSSTDSIIAFHAILAHTISDPALEHIIPFDKILTNIGAHFSPQTGVFTCDVIGAYHFSWMIKVPGGYYIVTELVRNGAVIGTAMSGDDSYWTTGAASVITMLNPGDEVWVRVSEHNGGADIAPTFSMFNGFLLH